MTTVDLLLRLQALDITVRLDGDRLKIGAPDGALTAELRTELAARKPEIAAFLREGSVRGDDAIAPLPHHAGVPVSFTQQRFWFFHNLVPDTSAYHVCFGLRLRGPLDRDVLSRALDEIVRRHALLRSVFSAPEGQPVQTVRPPAPVPLPVVDLTGVPADDRTARFEELAREVTNTPFDLTAQPPLRASLFALDAADHALIVAMHHIVSDAWSVTAFLRELGSVYDALSSGEPPALAPLPIQFADFASWQREQLARPELTAQRNYWGAQLAGAPTLNLPSDRPRPAFQSFRGGRTTFSLSRRLTDALTAIARQERATLFMALLAGFYGLLQRYSGQTDLVVGTAIAGRSRPEVEPLIGPFINTLALRTDASGDPTFRTLLARARETALAAYANQDLPFEKVVDELKLDRVLSRNPLFQVMLALQNVPAPPRALRDLELSPFDIDRHTTVSDLELIFWPTAAGLEGYVRYSVDLFDRATVTRMLDHLEVLLEAAVANPDRRLSDLPVLTATEHAQFLQWNATGADYPKAMPAHVAFEQQAARTPDALAVTWRGDRLTYRELDVRASGLAHRLLAEGIAPDDRVGLYLERSAGFIVAALAVMKAGAAYLPIETTCPADRLAYTIADAGVRLVIAEPSLASHVRGCGATVVAPDDPADLTRGRQSPRTAVQAANLAYVIYTSGSTGRPKGVALSHAGLMNLVGWHRRVYGVTEHDRSALVAGLGFDASVWELWPYLLSGASMHVPEDETRGSAALLLDWLAESGVSICFAPTPLAETMFDTPMPSHLALRALLTGGDKLHRVPPGLPFKVYNNYGPTESTVVASWIEAPPGDVTPSIGHPIDNTRVHVLDTRMNPAPIGVAGELYIAGDSLARGYLNRPDLTADRFVPDPFAVSPGGRLYRTGDRVRRLAGGDIDFLGRLDDQVKVRGFRIELGEIETVLGQHPAVREAVVVTREGRAGNRRLIAYVVAREGAIETAELTRFLKDKLPDYMVPSAIVALAAFPLTANGKVDRQALPDPAPLADGPQITAAPLTGVEARLADIWARVLRIPRVGPDDNFFEAGGDSILALQVVSAARQAGLWLSPRQMFEHPTVAGLATVAGVPERSPVVDDPTGEVPLTPIQHWFLAQDVLRPSHFNQAAMLIARRRLDAGRLEEALRVLTAHHDALRLRFTREAAGAWRQSYAASGPHDVTVESIDLSSFTQEARAAALQAEATRVQSSLELTTGPLVRAALFNLGSGEPQRVLIAIHHLVVDTVSWRILLADMEQVYSQLADGESPSLPAKTSSFKRWARELQQYAASGEAEQQSAYWRNASAGAFELPIDLSGGANTAGSTETVVLTIDEEHTEALLREAPKAYGLQANDVLIAAVARSLSRWTGARRVSLGLESYGRDALSPDLDLSRSVGWFTALYPLTLEVNRSDEAGELLKRVKEEVRGVPRLGIGFGVLRYLQTDGRGASLTARPPAVSFNYLGQFGDEGHAGLFALAPESAGASTDPGTPRAHAIDISARIVNGVLRLSFVYSRDLHLRGTIESLGRATIDAVRELIGHCLAPDAGGYTPSDFPEANASQYDLDRLFASLGQGRGNES